MNTHKSFEQPNAKSGLTGAILKRMLQIGINTVAQAAMLFISSGRLDWVMAWVYIGICVGIIVINVLIILPKNPELIAERGQIKEGTKKWDIMLTRLSTTIWAGALIVAGLDLRFGWSPQPILAIQLVALVFVVLGFGLVIWAMASNKFFSSVVRIQKDRGHTVVASGPYQYVRHPGYVGALTYSLTTPLLLGSLWALIPTAFIMFMVIIRTVLEDKTLLNELDGYQDYARRVRFRLLPGLW
ncbi:isoprenylcysteine carboxyl methyltransferase [bacterium (candidate division B38) B3_B38]|nr:MAG: isoprenylcysteine carboxyl methyltransferase [bacterium (candidate division B38) B3_B38]